jgi:hypothetical protein
VNQGFHFLDVSYLPTQPVNNTTAVPVDLDIYDQNSDKSGALLAKATGCFMYGSAC